MNFRRKRLSRAFFHSKLSIVKLGIREPPNSEFTKLGIFALSQRLHLRITGALNPCILKFLSRSLNLSSIPCLHLTIPPAFHL